MPWARSVGSLISLMYAMFKMITDYELVLDASNTKPRG